MLLSTSPHPVSRPVCVRGGQLGQSTPPLACPQTRAWTPNPHPRPYRPASPQYQAGIRPIVEVALRLMSLCVIITVYIDKDINLNAICSD